MIVGIIKKGGGLVALEEFKKATDEATAVSEFCSGYSPALSVADYLGVNSDSIDLLKNWGWDFSEVAPTLKEVIVIEGYPMPVNLGESNDYNQFRYYQNGILDSKTWANLSDSERDLMIHINIKESSISKSTDEVNKVTHLMITGQAADVESARLLIVNRWAYHHILDIDSCSARAKALRLYVEVGTYLSKEDAQDFFVTVENLYMAFRDQAIKGINYGTEIGIIDYIESTPGTIYEFAGLSSKGYDMQNGEEDMSEFKESLIDVLIHGKYINLEE